MSANLEQRQQSIAVEDAIREGKGFEPNQSPTRREGDDAQPRCRSRHRRTASRADGRMVRRT